ncbi:hypothetical protein D8Y22_21645 [Salinadaptatus halalkaliphilus]|uniref:Rpa-associated protein n=1 Tax=Salinadaptatus halalkaliphilus TaxID=2419781 RepID=A0A4V3VKT9_9EURY|nr:hypothetical protein [Salinadaptatus halalkaliphilus]THE63047.1 hypothetical protein D8Y22_21645 [Salinadaptatus halalkaliphilus]
MSASDDEEIPRREVAYRLFAAEYDDASLSHTESDEERAPNYVISPTGARLNRLFAVGTLTEVTSVNEEMVRARVVDPTGAFVVYAGQYQPDALATLESIEPPAFVAVTGKARTFEPDDGDRIYTSVRPESIATVDADTRDRWVVTAAEQTLERIGTYAEAAAVDARGEELTNLLEDAGVERGLAAGLSLAQDHYATTPSYLDALRDRALEAVAVVAGERDQVASLEIAPSGERGGDATFESLADLASVGLSDGIVDTGTDAPAEPPSTDFEATAATDSATGAVESSTVATDDSSPTETADSVTDDTNVGEPNDAAFEPDSSGVESTAAIDDEPGPADESAGSVTDSGDSSDSEAVVSASTEAAETGETAETDDRTEPATDDTDDLDVDDFDDGMYEMDDEEREQLEDEFGAEFTTGSEVDAPGESDIDVPEPADEGGVGDDETDPLETDDESASDDLAEAPTSTLEADPEPELGDSPESSLEAGADATDDGTTLEAGDAGGAGEDSSGDDVSGDATDDEPDEDVDLQRYVVETMDDLDDGDGADRMTVLETVVDETGAPEADVEDAIQDALMGGQCYEPADDKLKAI